MQAFENGKPDGAISGTIIRIYRGMQRLKYSTTREGLAMNAVRLAGGADVLRSLGILNDEEWANLLETIGHYEDEAKRICESEWAEKDCCSIYFKTDRKGNKEEQK